MIPSLRLVEWAQIVSALSTPALAYLYYRMLLIQKQVSTQKSQQKIMRRQQKLMSAEQSPVLQIDDYDLIEEASRGNSSRSEEYHKVVLSNVGNGVAKDLAIRFELNFTQDDGANGPLEGIPFSIPMTSFGFQSFRYPLTKGTENHKYVSMEGGGVLESGEKSVSFTAPVSLMYFDEYVSPEVDPAELRDVSVVDIDEMLGEIPYREYVWMELEVKLFYSDASGQSSKERLLLVEFDTNRDYKGIKSLRDLAEVGSNKWGTLGHREVA